MEPCESKVWGLVLQISAANYPAWKRWMASVRVALVASCCQSSLVEAGSKADKLKWCVAISTRMATERVVLHSEIASIYAVINTLRPRQNGRHFADAIFKCIFLNEYVWIPIKIPLKFVPQGPINNIPALVQIMAWCRPGDKPSSGPMMVRLPTHICITRPQWVKHIWHEIFGDIALQKIATVPHDKNVHDLNFIKYDVLPSSVLWEQLTCHYSILVSSTWALFYVVGIV